MPTHTHSLHLHHIHTYIRFSSQSNLISRIQWNIRRSVNHKGLQEWKQIPSQERSFLGQQSESLFSELQVRPTATCISLPRFLKTYPSLICICPSPPRYFFSFNSFSPSFFLSLLLCLPSLPFPPYLFFPPFISLSQTLSHCLFSLFLSLLCSLAIRIQSPYIDYNPFPFVLFHSSNICTTHFYFSVQIAG